MNRTLKIQQKQETDEEKAKRVAEMAERVRKAEEDIRLAVPRTIASLRKEAADKALEADRLEQLLAAFPDVRKYTGRWNKVAYYSKTANPITDKYDQRFNCGCCPDSPLEVWPYVETLAGRVYSDPPMFTVGEKGSGGAVPCGGWESGMLLAGIPQKIVGAIHTYFDACAEEALGETEDEDG